MTKNYKDFIVFNEPPSIYNEVVDENFYRLLSLDSQWRIGFIKPDEKGERYELSLKFDQMYTESTLLEFVEVLTELDKKIQKIGAQFLANLEIELEADIEAVPEGKERDFIAYNLVQAQDYEIVQVGQIQFFAKAFFGIPENTCVFMPAFQFLPMSKELVVEIAKEMSIIQAKQTNDGKEI